MHALGLLLLGAALAADPAPRSASRPQRRPKVMVLQLKADSEGLRKTAGILTEVLATDLARSGRLEVLGEADLVTLLGFEKQRQLLGCEDTGCLAAIGGAMGVNWIVAGSLGSLGELTRVDVKVLDPLRTRVTARHGFEAREVPELLARVRELVPQLVPVMDPTAPAAPPPKPEVTTPVARGPGPAPFVLLGAGVAVAGAGAVLVAVGNGFKGEDLSRWTYREAEVKQQQAQRKIEIGTAGLAVGGAAAVAGLVWWLAAPSGSVPVALMPVPGGAVVSAAGRF